MQEPKRAKQEASIYSEQKAHPRNEGTHIWNVGDSHSSNQPGLHLIHRGHSLRETTPVDSLPLNGEKAIETGTQEELFRARTVVTTTGTNNRLVIVLLDATQSAVLSPRRGRRHPRVMMEITLGRDTTQNPPSPILGQHYERNPHVRPWISSQAGLEPR